MKKPTYEELERRVRELEEASDRDKAENVLRESDERYKALFDRSLDCVYLSDFHGNFIDANPAALNLMGYRKEEIGGLNFRSLLDESQLPVAMEVLQELMENGCQKELTELTLRRKDGSYVHLESKASVIYRDGKPFAVQGVARDISERKKIETRLMESERQYRTLFQESVKHHNLLSRIMETSPAAILLFDKKRNVTFSNSGAERVLGLKKEKIIGSRYDELGLEVRDYDGNSYFPENLPFPRIMKGKQPLYDVRYAIKRIDGLRVLLSVNAAPLFDETGQVEGIVAILEDVTEKVELESRLRQSQKMEAIGTLAGGIAHDFNNILGVIIGYVEMMEMFDMPAESSLHPGLEEVLKAAHRAEDLIRQILTFSRQTGPDKKPISLGFVVREAVRFLRASLPSTIEIRHCIDAETETVLADATQMHQVIMNLCTNAAHAMKQKGGILEIGLRWGQPEEMDAGHRIGENKVFLKLSVSDTGDGISPGHLSRIFEPYFTTKEKEMGTGLGLALVHGIVKSHNGIIEVSSEVGKGATFSVYLPVTETMARPAGRRLDPVFTGNGNVLLIDDEQALLRMGTHMLERLGYRVDARSSPEEALDLFRKSPDRFDLVITDMTMPHLTGDELSRELLKIRPGIPVILCTGCSEYISEDLAEQIGIRKLMMKPFSIHQLSRAIREILNPVVN